MYDVCICTLYYDIALFVDFVMNCRELFTKKKLKSAGVAELVQEKGGSCDPAVRTAFSSRLDRKAQETQNRLVIEQQVYLLLLLVKHHLFDNIPLP